MEINKEQLNENRQRIFFRIFNCKGIITITCALAETQRQEALESFMMENREGFRYVLFGGCWHGEAIGGLTIRRASFVTYAYLAFSGPVLEIGTKIREDESY